MRRSKLSWLVVSIMVLLPIVCNAQIPREVYDTNTGAPTNLATAEVYGSASYYCNEDWEVPMYVHACVHQWLQAFIDATQLYWHIYKPGDYYTLFANLYLTSNGDLQITTIGADDLANIAGEPDSLDAYYQFTLGGAHPTWWVDVPANQPVIDVPENEEHQPIHVTFWNRLIVEPCDSACNYDDEFTLVVYQMEQKIHD